MTEEKVVVKTPSTVIKIKPVTEEEWELNNPFNMKMAEKFLRQQTLSDKTLKQYKSAIRIFLRFVKDELDNKPIHKLRPRHALEYQEYLMSIGLSSNAVKFKRSVVSSLCNYIEVYYGEDYPDFRNIFNKAIPNPPKELVKQKLVLTKEDIDRVVEELEKEKQYQMIAYFLLSYSTGARRAEIAQMKKDFFTFQKAKGKEYYTTPEVRGKGRGKAGKKIKLKYDDRAREAVLKWLEVRGEDEEEHVFVRKYGNGKIHPLNPDTFNQWFKKTFNPILGFDLSPHGLRRSRATHLVVEDGKNIEVASALLNHSSTEVTKHYVMKDDDDSLDEAF